MACVRQHPAFVDRVQAFSAQLCAGVFRTCFFLEKTGRRWGKLHPRWRGEMKGRTSRNPGKLFMKRDTPAPWKQWGDNLEEGAVEQMRNACLLPIAMIGALMPDAHQGYGLPIGGVLATRGAVIPYAVGMDIACRMKLSVLDLPVSSLKDQQERLKRAILEETSFGVGATFRKRKQHPVMDDSWSITRITESLKDKAWSQLGTSGSGNHFVEFGELVLERDELGLKAGVYLALLSHSGSRGSGNEVATHYSRIAQLLRPELPKEMRNLAWLELGSEEGEGYWSAMELMGRYAAANHELIHRAIATNLGVAVLLDVENHHNFAWKEAHAGEDVVVHRKGATPAAAGVVGVIPGSMATAGYVVRGKGNPASLSSASHGAGRRMSRKAAKEKCSWSEASVFLAKRGVTLISGGLDEVPMAYKDIEAVMAAQSDLVEIVARFNPKLVKMAPGGGAEG
ncbi:MAG: RtcB family protein [Desulfuromonadales bacterium]|nr:RtcB family protein [Desulfuromonadales bacterium]